MLKGGKTILYILILFLISCSAEKKESVKLLPLNSHEHKLLLNNSKFENMEKAFSDYWNVVKMVAGEQGLDIVEFDNKLAQRHNMVIFYDTKNLDLNKKGFLIRKRTKFKGDKLDSTFTLTIKFKHKEYEIAALADLKVGEGYTPKDTEIEVEADLINGPKPESDLATFYSVQNSVVLSKDTGKTLADYSDIFPVLKSLDIDLSLELMPVNGIETEEFMVKPGRINFGNELFGRVDMSVWEINGKVIPEFSFDHPLDGWNNIPEESVRASETFISHLQEKAPDWYVDGKLKAAFVFNQ